MTTVIRTCVVCRKGVEKGELFRFVSPSDEAEKSVDFEPRLVLDVLGYELGRGAYCHQERKCFFCPTLGTKLLFSLRGRRKEKGRGPLNFQLEQIIREAIKALENKTRRGQAMKQLLEGISAELVSRNEISLRETKKQGKKSRLLRL